MKQITTCALLLFTFFISIQLNAQSPSADQLVKEFLGDQKYQSSISDNPGLIEYLKIKSTEGYKIDTVAIVKFNQLPVLPQILYMKNEITPSEFATAAKADDFNFLLYSFPGIEKGVFRLDASDNTIIVIQSNEYINKQVRNR
nr:hypothetical protein [uncultured Brumimicrobium sp.]